MAEQRNGAGTGRRPMRVLLMIAALLAAVFAVFMIWSLFGGNDASAPGLTPGQTAEDGAAGTQGETVNGDSKTGGGEAPAGEGDSAAGANQDNAVALLDSQVTQAELDAVYDIVIQNGRVINPETQLDEEGLHVGIKDGTVGVVTSKPLKGERTIDATGLVVAPGFIDNLSYDPNPLGVWNKIADGVTTNIAMHGGTSSPAKWYAYYERDKPPVHFGASFFYTQARNQFKLSRYAGANADQIAKLKQQAEEALNNGALGISFSLEYVPGITSEEVLALMELAKEYNVPTYFHGRYSDMEEPGTNFDTMNELIGYARASGAAVHIDHINSTGGTFSMKESLAMIDEALAEGLDITACLYPYNYWGTYLNSARFDEGWQERFRITYEDLQIAGTSERLTAETFRKYQKEGKLAVAYAIPEQDVVDAFQAPYVMIGSDAILEPGHNNHPRASGTFARTLGLYAREKSVITLSEAIAKLSLMPAQRLEKQVPALQKKGRIAKGMDADIVVFDYDTVIDKSTVEQPDLYSEGMEYVLVNGQVALDQGELNKSVRVGQAIRSEFVRFKETAGSLNWGTGSYPLVAYNDEVYVDLAAFTEQGYALAWDKLSLTYTLDKTAAGSAGASESKASQQPKSGELMLERGYQVKTADKQSELISIGERAFVPLKFLEDTGLKVSNEGDVWTADAA
ncbi:amidohydrolase family protein [Paenibacillus sambharensis]|nr:amidohydrolase family protein [Paenibacillus sambharensis]